LVRLSPYEQKVYKFDWSGQLAVGVTIDESDFFFTAIRPKRDTSLTLDNETILADERSTWVRLSTPTEGAKYEIANRITTNESPSRTLQESFFLLGEGSVGN